MFTIYSAHFNAFYTHLNAITGFEIAYMNFVPLIKYSLFLT